VFSRKCGNKSISLPLIEEILNNIQSFRNLYGNKKNPKRQKLPTLIKPKKRKSERKNFFNPLTKGKEKTCVTSAPNDLIELLALITANNTLVCKFCGYEMTQEGCKSK
jgi:hypothetical protein